MEIIDTVALISINETAIAQLVSFLIFLFIMNRIMFRPIRNTMEKRSDFIKNLKQDTDNAENEFDNLSFEFNNKQKEIKIEALKIAKEIEESAKLQAKEINEITRNKTKVLLKNAETQIKQQVDIAKTSFSHEVEIIMVNIMEKILNRRLAQ